MSVKWTNAPKVASVDCIFSARMRRTVRRKPITLSGRIGTVDATRAGVCNMGAKWIAGRFAVGTIVAKVGGACKVRAVFGYRYCERRSIVIKFHLRLLLFQLTIKFQFPTTFTSFYFNLKFYSNSPIKCYNYSSIIFFSHAPMCIYYLLLDQRCDKDKKVGQAEPPACPRSLPMRGTVKLVTDPSGSR